MKTNLKLSLLCASALAITAASCGKGDEQQQGTMQVPEIATVTVQYGTSDLNFAYPATIEGIIDTDVRPQVSGTITRVLVEEGQHVSKGQVMFQLDDVTYREAVNTAEAALTAAKVAEATARSTEQQKKRLFEKQIIGQYEYDLALNQLNQAKAQVASAQAQLTSARNNLGYASVKAPANGVVGQIPFREGYLAGPSMQQPLTTVSDISKVVANFSLTENDLLQATGGESFPPVQLQLANGTVYPLDGTVESVSGKIDPSTGAARVRAVFDNPDGVIRSGSTGKVLIPQRLDKVIIIPQNATFEIQDKRFVYVVGDSAKTVSTAVTVSPLSDGKNFIVTSGLQPGQQVVVEGVGTQVKDGMVIKPVDAAARAAAQQQGAQGAQGQAGK